MMMSFISTILLPIRNVMPIGTYLGYKHRYSSERRGGGVGAGDAGPPKTGTFNWAVVVSA